MSWSYGFDDTSLNDVDLVNADPSIINSMNVNTTSFVTLGFSRDTRNNLYVTTEGSVNTIRVEYAGSVLGGDSQYTKVEASTSWFFHGFVFDDTAFHYKIAAGQVWENEAGKLPDFEKFYLGGINSIRGFPSRSIAVPVAPYGPDDKVGGEIMWYMNIEYHFPLVKQGGLRGLIFYDAGNVYENDWDFNDIKKSVGAGFRWISPMGPFRLEWAYVIDPQPGEDTSNWEFSIGGAF
jgi:outer membrane protein insertion porin family